MAQVKGFEPNESGQEPTDDAGNPVAVGVWGDSDIGVGVFGSSGPIPAAATDLPVQIAGVEGHGFERPGVVGRSLSDSGVDGESTNGLGVLGRSHTGTGVLGVTFNTEDPRDGSGVFGSSTANGNGVTGFVGSQTGVVGSSVRGTGVHGISTGVGVFGENIPGGASQHSGVLGVSTAGPGVTGLSATGVGVRGDSEESNGITGIASGGGVGCAGFSFSTVPGSGVEGTSVLGTGVIGFSFTETGVVGQSSQGLAGDFIGDVRVSGALFKGGGGFEIDHPLDPENKYLAHSFVESPEMLNVYSGTVTTDEAGNGEAVLPDYCEALNGEFRYQLTVIGEFAQAIVGREVESNRFLIRTDRPRVKVCWQVTGVRLDRWARANTVNVESSKDEADRGRYLHPELWGQGAQGIRSRVDEARRHMIETMPDSIRDRCEALLTNGQVDHDELRQLIDEGAQVMAGPQRTDPVTFENDWHTVQQMLQPYNRGDDIGES